MDGTKETKPPRPTGLSSRQDRGGERGGVQPHEGVSLVADRTDGLLYCLPLFTPTLSGPLSLRGSRFVSGVSHPRNITPAGVRPDREIETPRPWTGLRPITSESYRKLLNILFLVGTPPRPTQTRRVPDPCGRRGRSQPKSSANTETRQGVDSCQEGRGVGGILLGRCRTTGRGAWGEGGMGPGRPSALESRVPPAGRSPPSRPLIKYPDPPGIEGPAGVGPGAATRRQGAEGRNRAAGRTLRRAV